MLILGGTGEARELAAALLELSHDVTSSLAGRVREPRLPVGRVRIGGFGGVAGLAAALPEFDCVVDATHPFAARITSHAVAACGDVGTPLLLVRRPGWREAPGDDWRRTAGIDAAAQAVSALPDGCVFLTTGRRDLAAFSADERHEFLVRSVDEPAGALPARANLILARGPYTVGGEASLMRQYRVIALVTKDSGGEMTRAKLLAARARAIPVIMIDRPALPSGVPTVETVTAARDWVGAH